MHPSPYPLASPMPSGPAPKPGKCGEGDAMGGGQGDGGPGWDPGTGFQRKVVWGPRGFDPPRPQNSVPQASRKATQVPFWMRAERNRSRKFRRFGLLWSLAGIDASECGPRGARDWEDSPGAHNAAERPNKTAFGSSKSVSAQPARTTVWLPLRGRGRMQPTHQNVAYGGLRTWENDRK